VRLTRGGAASALAPDDLARRQAAGVQARRARSRVHSQAEAALAPDGPRDATQFDVAISPDGKRVAWVEQRIGVVVATAYTTTESIDNAIEKPGQIALFDARTAKLVANLTTGGADSGPVFSPAATRVAFTRGSSIWTVPAAGAQGKRLVARGTQPAWGR
jgi:hypothetical protein